MIEEVTRNYGRIVWGIRIKEARINDVWLYLFTIISVAHGQVQIFICVPFGAPILRPLADVGVERQHK